MKNTSKKGFNQLPETGRELVVARDGKTLIIGGHVADNDELLDKSKRITTCINCGFLINLDFKGTSSPCPGNPCEGHTVSLLSPDEVDKLAVNSFEYQSPCSVTEPYMATYVKPSFPELKFKNGEFEK